ncbi:MAG: hypothetical protein WAM05_19625, partial [Candidatus Binataceae bacterium]
MFRRISVVILLGLIAFALLGLTEGGVVNLRLPAGSSAVKAISGGPSTAAALKTFAKLPLAFEPAAPGERGVDYRARGNGFEVALDSRGATFITARSAGSAPGIRGMKPGAMVHPPAIPKLQYSAVRMTLANHAAVEDGEASQRLRGVVNYYQGKDRSKWRSDVPTYGQVRYREVYPGIDLVYHGEKGRFEFDFNLAAGANPAPIGLAFEGAKKVAAQADGSIVVDSGTGNIRL